MASFGADFVVDHSQVLRLALPFLLRHLSLIPQVNLIADEESKAFACLVLVVQLQPCLSVVERGLAADIEHDERAVRIPQVPRDERDEPLLSGGVPKLQSIIFILIDDILGEKVDADSRLHQSKGTCDP